MKAAINEHLNIRTDDSFSDAATIGSDTENDGSEFSVLENFPTFQEFQAFERYTAACFKSFIKKVIQSFEILMPCSICIINYRYAIFRKWPN